MGSASSEIFKITEKAKSLEENGDCIQAIELLSDANNKLPRKMPILYLLSLFHLKSNRYYDAMKYANQFLELARISDDTGDIAKAYYIIAETERNLEHYDEAIKYYKLGQKNDFISYLFPLGLAKCYIKLQKYEDALTNYNKAMSSVGDEAIETELRYTISELNAKVPKLKEIAAHKEKAQFNFQRCKYEAGKVEYQKLFELSPDDYDLKRDYFSFLIKVKKYSEAIKFGENLITSIENKEDYLDTRTYWTVLCMVHEGLIEAYNATWHFIKSHNSKSLREYFLLLNRGNYEAIFSKEKQIAAYKDAHTLSPKRPEAILRLITCYSLSNDYTNAHFYVNKGLTIAEKTHNKLFTKELYRLEASIYEIAKQKESMINSYRNMLKYCNNAKSKYQAYYCCACSLFVLKDYKLAERELELCRQLTDKGIEDPEDIESMIVTCKAKQNPSLYGQKEDFI